MPGDRITYGKQLALTTGDDISIVVMDDCKDGEKELHSHPFWEIMLHSVSKRLEDNIEKITIMPPNTKHVETCFEHYGWNACYQVWEKGFRSSYVMKKEGTINMTSGILTYLVRMLEHLQQLHRDYGEQVQSLLNAHTRVLAMALLKLYDTGLQMMQPPSKGNTFIIAARFIHMNLPRASLTIAEVAQYVGIRENGLARIFRAKVGMSARRYLVIARLRWLCAHCFSKDTTLKILAEHGGWSSKEYMTMTFKRITGMTLKEYSRGATAGKMPPSLCLPQTDVMSEIL